MLSKDHGISISAVWNVVCVSIREAQNANLISKYVWLHKRSSLSSLSGSSTRILWNTLVCRSIALAVSVSRSSIISRTTFMATELMDCVTQTNRPCPWQICLWWIHMQRRFTSLRPGSILLEFPLPSFALIFITGDRIGGLWYSSTFW